MPILNIETDDVDSILAAAAREPAGTRKKNRLYAMKLNEVSFVPSGMNQHAHVTLMKRRDEPSQTTTAKLATTSERTGLKMSKHEQILKAAKGRKDGRAKFGAKDYETALNKLAEEYQEHSMRRLTFEQAFDKALRTEDGTALYRALCNAQDREAMVTKAGLDVLQKQADDAWSRIETMADEHRAQKARQGERITKEMAISHVLTTDAGRVLQRTHESAMDAIKDSMF